MALPKPNYSFTIPSVHDDTLLDCRLYHSKQQLQSDLAVHRTKAAIVAHPYAPLGGSYDDPVVASIGKTLLSAGSIVGTFNFRGGGGSPGRTSWSAKPELADYVSFYGFMLSYLSAILKDVGPEELHPSEQPSSRSVPATPSNQETLSAEARQPVRLVLAGYSYGSMITSHLPAINAVLNIFRTPPSDSAAAEISLRASTMARLHNKDVESRRSRKNDPQSRGRSSLRVADASTCAGSSSSHAVSVGGFESEPTSRRISRESARRSLDVGGVRQSIDRVREKFASRQDGGSSNSNNANTNTNIDHDTSPVETTAAICPGTQLQPPEVEVCYLLISPLLPPVASFTTMFSTLSYLTTPTTTTTELTLHPSLAVYGTKDTFTSRRKLRKWAEQLQQKSKHGGSRFEFCEVDGAGHFWHEGDAVERMTGAVRDWLGRLDAPP